MTLLPQKWKPTTWDHILRELRISAASFPRQSRQDRQEQASRGHWAAPETPTEDSATKRKPSQQHGPEKPSQSSVLCDAVTATLDTDNHPQLGRPRLSAGTSAPTSLFPPEVPSPSDLPLQPDCSSHESAAPPGTSPRPTPLLNVQTGTSLAPRLPQPLSHSSHLPAVLCQRHPDHPRQTSLKVPSLSAHVVSESQSHV